MTIANIKCSHPLYLARGRCSFLHFRTNNRFEHDDSPNTHLIDRRIISVNSQLRGQKRETHEISTNAGRKFFELN